MKKPKPIIILFLAIFPAKKEFKLRHCPIFQALPIGENVYGLFSKDQILGAGLSTERQS